MSHVSETRVLGIIVNYNGGHWVVDAVASLRAQDYPLDVLVIDSASTDGSAEAIRAAHPGVPVIETGRNIGPIAGYNYALAYPQYEYYLFFNPDALAETSMVRDLVTLIEDHPNVAVIGPAIVEYDRPDVVQAFDPRPDFLLFPFDRWEARNVADLPDVDVFYANYACAATILCRGDVFRRLGGMDERFFMFVDEPDYCWRARLTGFDTAVTPRVRVRHFGGVSATVGYKEQGYVTSLRRIYLRERNSLMLAIKCYALPTLALYFALLGLTVSLECGILILLGRWRIAREYWRAIRDALGQWRGLMASRKAIQGSRTVSEWQVLKTLTPAYAKLNMLFRRGVPIIAGWGPATKPTS